MKAPKDYEPPIPDFSEVVVVVAGISVIGEPLTEETVYFPELFSQLSGLELNHNITSDAICKFLCNPSGGLKNIPSTALRIALLNQADTPELQSIARSMVPTLLPFFESVIITSLKDRSIYAAHEQVA